MQSKATSVGEYLAGLPADRRSAIEAVRKVVLANLDGDYEEGMQYGMIGYYVPHRVFPAGYHCDPRQPLPFVALASQKNHLALYMMCQYADDAENDWFRKAWAATGRKLDMGKSCIRFRRVEDLALDVIAEAIRRVPVRRHIEVYLASLADRPSRESRASGGPTAKAATKGKAKAKAKTTVRKGRG